LVMLKVLKYPGRSHEVIKMPQVRNNRNFGWHAGTVTAWDMILNNDFYIYGDLHFGDVSTDTLTINGNLICLSDVDMTFGAGEELTITKTGTGYAINATGFVLLSPSRIDVTTGYESYFEVEGTLDSTGSVGGVKTRGIDIDLERPTAVVGNGDSRDQALKISITNEVTGHTAGYFLRGIDAQAKSDAAGGTLSALYGANVTCYNKNGTVLDAYALRLGMKNDGVITTNLYGLYVQDESQGTNNGVHYGVYVTTANYNPAGGRDAAIYVDSLNTSGWTTGIDLNGVMVTGIDIAAATTGIAITGATTTAFDVTGAFTTGFSLDADGTTGFEITSNFSGTTGFLLAGTANIGISITGATTTGISISGTAGTDILLQNGATIVNGAAGLLTITETSITLAADVSVVKTDDGATGAEFYLTQISDNPAALDVVGVIYGRGRNSIDGDINYGVASFGIIDPTSTTESAGFTISLQNGSGALPTTPQFTINGLSGAVDILRESDGTEGAALSLTQISASAAANDQIGFIKFLGNNDQSPVDLIEYTQIYSIITDVTADAEWGQGRFKALNGTTSLGVAGGWSHDGSYGHLIAGDGSGLGYFSSMGDNDVVLATGNATTGSITITDGANGNITLTPNGIGLVDVAGLFRLGTSGSPITTALTTGVKIMEMNTETTGASGATRGLYLNHKANGAGTGTGEAIRGRLLCSAATGSMTGVSGGFEFESTGAISGSATGMTGTMLLNTAGQSTGGLYGISACMHFLGTGGVPTDHAILEIRAAGNATGADLCLNAMSICSTGTNSGSSGYMIYNHDSSGATESNGSVRILVDEGAGKVARYIRYWDAEN